MKWTQDWIQVTIVEKNGVITTPYESKVRAESKMIDLLLQGHFLKQAGEDIEYDAIMNKEYEWVEIHMIRRMKDRTVMHIYKGEGGLYNGK